MAVFASKFMGNNGINAVIQEMSRYGDLILCWHKLEFFSPADLPKVGVNVLKGDGLPWLTGAKSSASNKMIIYLVYLGVFDRSFVNFFVKGLFGVSVEPYEVSSKICYASLKLDKDGKYINDTLGVSTLPWALMLLKEKIWGAMTGPTVLMKR